VDTTHRRRRTLSTCPGICPSHMASCSLFARLQVRRRCRRQCW
jgi:hypothetical protein